MIAITIVCDGRHIQFSNIVINDATSLSHQKDFDSHFCGRGNGYDILQGSQSIGVLFSGEGCIGGLNSNARKRKGKVNDNMARSNKQQTPAPDIIRLPGNCMRRFIAHALAIAVVFGAAFAALTGRSVAAAMMRWCCSGPINLWLRPSKSGQDSSGRAPR